MHTDNLEQIEDVSLHFNAILKEGYGLNNFLESATGTSEVLKHVYISSSRDIMCASTFGLRCIDFVINESTEFDPNILLRSFSIELSLWTRKILEHLVKSIIFKDYNREQLFLFLRCDALQYLLRNKNDISAVFTEDNGISDILNIRKSIKESSSLNSVINIIDLDKLNNELAFSIIRPIEQQYFKAIELGNWHERFLLGSNFEIIYGLPSYQIHANTLLHERDYSKTKFLNEVEILGHIQNLLLIRLYEMCGLESQLFLGDESESENDFKEMWMKEFNIGDKIKDSRTGEMVEVVDIISDSRSRFNLDIK